MASLLSRGTLLFLYFLSINRSELFPIKVFLDGYNSIVQLLVCLTFMPHQALNVLDAIIRTLVRLVHRRNLLEWVTVRVNT